MADIQQTKRKKIPCTQEIRIGQLCLVHCEFFRFGLIDKGENDIESGEADLLLSHSLSRSVLSSPETVVLTHEFSSIDPLYVGMLEEEIQKAVDKLATREDVVSGVTAFLGIDPTVY